MPGEALLRDQPAACQNVPRRGLRRRSKSVILWVGTGSSLSRERVSLLINGYGSATVQDIATAATPLPEASATPVRRRAAPGGRLPSEGGPEPGEVGRQRGAEDQGLPRGRVLDPQQVGMQRLPSETPKGLPAFGRQVRSLGPIPG